MCYYSYHRGTFQYSMHSRQEAHVITLRMNEFATIRDSIMSNMWLIVSLMVATSAMLHAAGGTMTFLYGVVIYLGLVLQQGVFTVPAMLVLAVPVALALALTHMGVIFFDILLWLCAKVPTAKQSACMQWMWDLLFVGVAGVSVVFDMTLVLLILTLVLCVRVAKAESPGIFRL